jgi:hypothetical protein
MNVKDINRDLAGRLPLESARFIILALPNLSCHASYKRKGLSNTNLSGPFGQRGLLVGLGDKC